MAQLRQVRCIVEADAIAACQSAPEAQHIIEALHVTLRSRYVSSERSSEQYQAMPIHQLAPDRVEATTQSSWRRR
jgi:hypothetical protein